MSAESLPTAVLVVGPTASGKSALALSLAQELNGVVINADSMQVYKGLPLLTAQPTAADQAMAGHRLYGVLAPDDPCSAARWRDMATDVLYQVWSQGRLPVITGGTGLYVRALCQGLSPMPDVPDTLRQQARADLERMGNAAFHARLATVDPAMAAKLDAGNSQRLVRAWEIWQASGQTFSHWQSLPPEGAVAARWITILLDPPRPALRDACARRFAAMVEQGAIEEVTALRALGLDPALPLMKALGVPELSDYLDGLVTLDAATARAIQSTVAYAKRQGTWFRHQLPAIDLTVEQLSESLLERIFIIIRQTC